MSKQHIFQTISLAAILPGHNIRKVQSNDQDNDILINSIQSHGLLENLVIQPDKDKADIYHVVAGHRRLKALIALRDSSDIPADHPIPCLILDSDADPREIALAENTARAAMHPADQALVFRTLVNNKRNTVTEIASRFGLSERTVNMRLRMANLHADILAAYRRDEIGQEMIRAFMISKDKSHQKAVFDWAINYEYGINVNMVRSRITQNKINGDNKLAKFVTREAYIEAGGEVVSDLFGNEDDPTSYWFTNTELLEKLATEKLNAIAEKQDPRWSWITPITEFSYEEKGKYKEIEPVMVEPTDKEMKVFENLENVSDKLHEEIPDKERTTLEKKYEKLHQETLEIEQNVINRSEYAPEQYSNGGCIVTLDQSGNVNLQPGLIRNQDWKNFQKETRSAKTQGSGSGNTASAQKYTAKSYNNSLAEDMAYVRNTIIKTTLTQHPALALDLLTYEIAHTLKASRYYRPHTMQLQITGTNNQPVSPDPKIYEQNNPFMQNLDDIINTLKLDWMDNKNQYAGFKQFQALSQTDKMDILAASVSMSLHRQLNRQHTDHSSIEALETITGQMDITWRNGMPLTAKFFFNRLSKQTLYDIGDSLVGKKNWSAKYSNDKKIDISKRLEVYCDPNQPSPELTADQKQKAVAFIPLGIVSTPHKDEKSARKPRTNKQDKTTQDDKKTSSATTTDPVTAPVKDEENKGNGHLANQPPASDVPRISKQRFLTR